MAFTWLVLHRQREWTSSHPIDKQFMLHKFKLKRKKALKVASFLLVMDGIERNANSIAAKIELLPLALFIFKTDLIETEES